MKTIHVTHRFGGKITAVTAVAHVTYRGVASWHFIGDVDWSDGGKSIGTEIAPYQLCFDQADPASNKEGTFLHGRMSEYLSKAGKWHDQKKTRDGRYFSWTPHEKSGIEAVL